MDLFFIMLGSSLILGTGLFVSVEFVFLSLNRAQLEGLKVRDREILRSHLARTSTHLSVAQFGITLATLLTGFTLEPVFARFFAHLPASSLIAVLLATFLSMLFGEIVPKNLALSRPLTMARIVLYPYLFFYKFFLPLVNLLDASSNFCARKMGLRLKQELTDFRDAGEMHTLFRHSAQAGAISKDQCSFFLQALSLSGKTVSDIMTPRVRVRSVTKDATMRELQVLSLETGYSEFPVVGRGMDDICGVVNADRELGRDCVLDAPVSNYMQPAIFCASSAGVGSLLDEFEGKSIRFAIVVDEYGGTDGIVTRMDVMRQFGGVDGPAFAFS